jgi:catechol 2,3-dioxygenase-like lactoylglutathione lyase family enzyme
VATFNRIAPIFPVRDVEVSLAHYEKLGFTTRMYEQGGYGFAVRDGVELHLGIGSAERHGPASAYLFVDDADALAQTWRSAGVHVHQPQDTAWGQHEGAVEDPDGNVIRFGSPIRTTHRS